MKLWILRPTEKGLKTNWDPWYDKYFGFVIAATTEKKARKIANEKAGDENRGEFMLEVTSTEKHPWLNSEYSTCDELIPNEEGVIIEDYRGA
jgi:hypothetical protein